MRKIQNNSLVRFFHGNLEGLVRNPLTDHVKARSGDILRFLVNKYELGSEEYENLKLCLLPVQNPVETPVFERTPVAIIGAVRRQASERFVHFKFRVGSFQKNVYKQFSFDVKNSNSPFPVFSYSGESMSDLMQQLSDHIQNNPYSVFKTKVNGSIIDVYASVSDSFNLESDLSVVLGEVSGANQNNPLMQVVDLGSYIRGATTVYDLIVSGTIVSGNKFSLNGLEYTASKNTTAKDVINFFTDGSGELSYLNSASISLNFDPGSTTKINSNNPFITKYLDSNSSGKDHYLIKLSGSYQVGNVLNVSAPGKNIVHTVEQGDTISSIEAILNPDGGFFDVPTGSQVLVKSISGRQDLLNNNLVQFTLRPKKSFPSATYEKYGVLIGSDIAKGNQFRIIDIDNNYSKTVIATSKDDNISIAKQFQNTSTAYFIFERIQGENPVSFESNKGFKYISSEDTMDVSIISQPTITRPDQVVIEVTVPDKETLPHGDYILALINSIDEEIKSISSVMSISDHPQTSIIEFSDSNNVFDLNYAEGGLVQRFRAGIATKIEEPVITETIGETIENIEQSINVKIDYASKFSSMPMGVSLAKSLISSLKHSFLRINERAARASEVTYKALSQYGEQVEVSGSITYIDEYVHNHDRMIFPRILAGSNAVISSEYSFGLRLFLRHTTFIKEILGKTVVPANGYNLEVMTESIGFGFLRILVRDEKEVLVEMEVDKNVRFRSAPFRIQPGSKVLVEIEEIASLSNTDYTPVPELNAEVIYQPEKEPNSGPGFDDGFDESFN